MVTWSHAQLKEDGNHRRPVCMWQQWAEMENNNGEKESKSFPNHFRGILWKKKGVLSIINILKNLEI